MTLLLNDGNTGFSEYATVTLSPVCSDIHSHKFIFCIHYCLNVYGEVGFIIVKLRTGALWAPDTHMFSVSCSHAITKTPLRFELICNLLKHIFRNKRHVSFHESIPNDITCLIHYFSYSIVVPTLYEGLDIHQVYIRSKQYGLKVNEFHKFSIKCCHQSSVFDNLNTQGLKD